MKNMKKIFVFLLLMTVILGGCSNQKTNSVDITDLQNTMLEAGKKFPEMKKVSSKSENASELFSYLSDMDYKKVKNFYLAYAKDGKADELAVIEVAKKDDIKEAVESLTKHVESRVKLYNSYQPEEVQKAQNSMVFSKGNYAVLIASDDNMDIKAAFEKAVEE